MENVQKIRTSELRYRRLFEAAQDGILILDAQTGAITDVNPFLIKLLGYSRAEFVEKKLWEVGAFKDIEASREAFEVLQKDEYIRYEDLPLRAKSGRLVDVEFVSNVYLVGGEKVIQCNIRDISERKQAQDALLQRHALLREQSVRDHLTSLFNRRYMEETLSANCCGPHEKDSH
jgi:PAS domain S-box-containing protein